MNKTRLEALSDGVFAIIMTLLVIEIHVPEFDHANNQDLLTYLIELTPIFTSYFLSFFVLVMFWIQHHAMFHFFTKTINRQLVVLNMILLSILVLIPFSAGLLGSYPQLSLAINFYGLNIILACLGSIALFKYALSSKEIEREEISSRQVKQAKIRLYLTPLLTLIGMAFAFINPALAPFFFLIPIFFNIIPGGLDKLEKLFGFKL